MSIRASRLSLQAKSKLVSLSESSAKRFWVLDSSTCENTSPVRAESSPVPEVTCYTLVEGNSTRGREESEPMGSEGTGV